MDTRTKKLLTWYRRHGRSLPWRDVARADGTPDAYRIFISELMLQQTQVPRVIPKFLAWMRRFPSWKRLAAAPTADLLHAWAGLGYNRRALQAREAARFVIEHGEPCSEDEWKRLKGVGPYMAAALAEFANHTRAIVIDTNVRRVVGRVTLSIPHPRPTDDEGIRKQLEHLTPLYGAHWDLPQAFMDLGSAICIPRSPACAVCPLRDSCKAAPLFLSGQAPIRIRTASREKRHDEKPHPDRIYRGRILALVRKEGRVERHRIGRNIDPDFDPIRDEVWKNAMVDRLIKDGLLAMDKRKMLTLPKA
jgi:A/G-specific adenine glycosylase